MRGHTHIAAVREPDGRMLGIVTLEDVLEELVGEIRDEYDRLPAYVQRSGPAWIIGGGAALSAVREMTGLPFPLEAAAPETAAEAAVPEVEAGVDGPTALRFTDWMERRLGRRIKGGDVVRDTGTRVLARKARRGMLVEAVVHPPLA